MWGAQKAYDFKNGWYSLAHTGFGENPYIQLDYGVNPPGNITGIKIIGRQDCCVAQGSNLNVYVSATPDFRAGVLCAKDISVQSLGDTLMMMCPVTTFTTRYVTVMRNVTNHVLSLQEITALYDGKPRCTVGHVKHACKLSVSR
jgi:hypothetical protein